MQDVAWETRSTRHEEQKTWDIGRMRLSWNKGDGRAQMMETMGESSPCFCDLETSASVAVAVIAYRVYLLLIFSTWSVRFTKSAAI